MMISTINLFQAIDPSTMVRLCFQVCCEGCMSILFQYVIFSICTMCNS